MIYRIENQKILSILQNPVILSEVIGKRTGERLIFVSNPKRRRRGLVLSRNAYCGGGVLKMTHIFEIVFSAVLTYGKRAVLIRVNPWNRRVGQRRADGMSG